MGLPPSPTFVIVGDGHPAVETLRHLLLRNATVLAAYATAGQQNRGALTRLTSDAEIPLLDSDSLKTQPVRIPPGTELDWILNINSTVLLPAAVIGAARAGAINMHPGLLPEYAGLHTHQWAIRNGETEFGVTVHEMVPSVDAGDIIHRRTFEVTDSDTGLSLYLKCMEQGVEAFRHVIDTIMAGGQLDRSPQDLERRTLYRHRDAEDGFLDWSLSAESLERFVRAGSYSPLSSPSYTPTLRTPAGSAMAVIEVDVTTLAEGERGEPGQVLAGAEGLGPRVVCGDGMALRLRTITHDGAMLSGAAVERLVTPGEKLS